MRWLTAHAVCSTALRSVERARLRCLRRVQTPPPPELLSPFDPSLRMTPQLLRSAVSSPLGRSSTTTRQVDKVVAPLARAAGARTGPGRCAALAPSAFSPPCARFLHCLRCSAPIDAEALLLLHLHSRTRRSSPIVLADDESGLQATCSSTTPRRSWRRRRTLFQVELLPSTLPPAAPTPSSPPPPAAVDPDAGQVGCRSTAAVAVPASAAPRTATLRPSRRRRRTLFQVELLPSTFELPRRCLQARHRRPLSTHRRHCRSSP